MTGLKWGLALLGAAGAYASVASFFLSKRAEKLRGYVDTYLGSSPLMQPTIKQAAIQDTGITSEQFDSLAEQVRQDNIRKGIAAAATILNPRG